MVFEGEKWWQKWWSRTFWLAASWTLLVAFGVIAHIVWHATSVPVGELVTYGGLICLAYIGGEKAVDAFRERLRKGGVGNAAGPEHPGPGDPERS